MILISFCTILTFGNLANFYKGEIHSFNMKKEGKKVEEINEKVIGKGAAILFGAFLVIGIMFYATLSVVKSGENIGGASGSVTLSPEDKRSFNFGIEEALFALVFAFLITGFLLWVKSMILKNPYLGAGIGIIGIGIMGYGFSLRYWGPYSIVFMIVSGAVAITYLGANFFKYIKKDKYSGGEFDED